MENKKTTIRHYDRKILEHQTVGIFVDAENVEMSGLNVYKGRTDYKKLIQAIGSGRRVIRIIYYKPQHKEISEDFKKFWYDQGGEIKRPLKNADSFLTIDAVTLADKMDVIVIVGGDKDYMPLLWYVKSRGCKTEVWSYPETTSATLQETADFFYPIDESFIIKDASRRRSVRPEKDKPEVKEKEKEREKPKA